MQRLSKGILLLAMGLAQLACASTQTQAQSPQAKTHKQPPLSMDVPQAEDAKIGNAVSAMEAGDTGTAITILKDVQSRYPDNGVVLHELALAYRLSGRPEAAVSTLSSYKARLPALPLANLASALDEAGRSREAETLLREGVEKYPDSGLIFAALGTTLRGRGRVEEALQWYLRGIEAEPKVAGNYKNLAELLENSNSSGLALIFGEMFRLLEPNTDRSAAMAVLMVRVCDNAVNISKDSPDELSASVSLAPSVVIERPEQARELPLANRFELAFGPGLVQAHRDGLSLKTLYAARLAFVQVMRKPDTVADWRKVPLFDFLMNLEAQGHLEPFTYWLYAPAFPDEAQAWADEHPKELRALGEYLSAHRVFD